MTDNDDEETVFFDPRALNGVPLHIANAPEPASAGIRVGAGGPVWSRNPLAYVAAKEGCADRMRALANEYSKLVAEVGGFIDGGAGPAMRRAKLCAELEGEPGADRLAEVLSDPAMLQLTPEAKRALKIASVNRLLRFLRDRVWPEAEALVTAWHRRKSGLIADAEKLERKAKVALAEMGLELTGTPLRDRIERAEVRLLSNLAEWHRRLDLSNPEAGAPLVGPEGVLLLID